HVRGETSRVEYNPRHRWYYFSEMQTDTSFENPVTPEAPPRESIEVRTLVFSPPAALMAFGTWLVDHGREHPAHDLARRVDADPQRLARPSSAPHRNDIGWRRHEPDACLVLREDQPRKIH